MKDYNILFKEVEEAGSYINWIKNKSKYTAARRSGNTTRIADLGVQCLFDYGFFVARDHTQLQKMDRYLSLNIVKRFQFEHSIDCVYDQSREIIMLDSESFERIAKNFYRIYVERQPSDLI